MNKDSLPSLIVSAFRETEYGRALEAEYKKQYLEEQLRNPDVWLIGSVILFVILYPYFLLGSKK